MYCWQEGGIWGELDYLWISPLWHRKVTFLLYLGPNLSTLQSQINKVVSNWRKHLCGLANLKYTASIFCEHKSHWYNPLAENDYSASQDLHLFLFAVRKLRRWLLFPPQDDLDFSLSSRYISANKLFVTPYVHIAEKSALESLLSFQFRLVEQAFRSGVQSLAGKVDLEGGGGGGAGLEMGRWDSGVCESESEKWKWISRGGVKMG